MPKIDRKLMQMFGSDAGADQIAQFGSLAAAAPLFVNDGDPDTIQALPAWLEGWYGAVVGGNSPAIQDMNALLYVYAYQLCYLFQAGVAEWNDETTYFIGSMVNVDGVLYCSLTDDNLNNVVTDETNWALVGGLSQSRIVEVASSSVTLAPGYAGATFLVDTAALGAVVFNLVAGLEPGFTFTVKDTGGAFSAYNATVVPVAAELIEGVNTTYTCRANYGEWTFIFDGTDWWLK